MITIMEAIIHFLSKNKKLARRNSFIGRKKNFDDF